MMAFTWSPKFKGLYGVMQGRNDRIDKLVFRKRCTASTRGANLGWPYTLYDTALQARVLARPNMAETASTAAPERL